MKKAITMSSTKDDIFRQAVADANRMQKIRNYPLDQARRALLGLEDLIDATKSNYGAHFTPAEWNIINEAYNIIQDYVYDTTH